MEHLQTGSGSTTAVLQSFGGGISCPIIFPFLWPLPIRLAKPTATVHCHPPLALARQRPPKQTLTCSVYVCARVRPSANPSPKGSKRASVEHAKHRHKLH